MLSTIRQKGIGGFWFQGRLSALERACIQSYLDMGLSYTIFSYGKLGNIPDGIAVEDANKIVHHSMTQRIIHNGKPDLSHFSDLFRFEMIRQRDLVWHDLDLMIIADKALPEYKDIIVREEQGGINGAILYVSDARIIDFCLDEIHKLLDRELTWGQTGPRLLMAAIDKSGRQIDIYNHESFYPLEHYDIWKAFHPGYCEFCKEKSKSALTIHLFNNILNSIGMWKDMAPPKGCFLYEQLEKMDLLGLFKDTYPERVMTSILENFQYRQNGKALGIKTIIREIAPSIYRTYKHYRR
ncbi:hypothetical protein [Neorhizobium tomejilense]|uniref:hypothetical protein n=1 Tax=Neorhizobium tomejilense TaxID=2093828 RepID=UPI000E6CF776|nr:hypothetical protein [Neorhizobium tomejilense]